MCDSFFSLGNVFTHKCSENAFLCLTMTCLITKSLQGRGENRQACCRAVRDRSATAGKAARS